MKSLLALICIALFSLSGPETYVVDASGSTMEWTGYYLFSFGEHTGKIKLSEGKLIVDNNRITGGSFTIDMTSITCTDMAANDGGNDLVNHLKSDDFFSTAKFPEAKFAITKVEPIKDSTTGQPNFEISGTLTLKGVKNELTFPALLSVESDVVKANGKFKFDRTKWGVHYNSGKIFSEVGDNAISDAIGISFNIVARKR